MKHLRMQHVSGPDPALVARRLDVVQYDPWSKARRLVSRYGAEGAMAIASQNKAQCFTESVSYWATLSDFWADVELIIMGHEPDNLESNERVSR